MAIAERVAGIERWDAIGPENWPAPAWYSADWKQEKIRTYESYFTHQLRSRYMELEGDFRTAVGNFGSIDPITTERVVSLLHSARESLEGQKPELLTVSSILDLIERYMVGYYPAHFVRARTVSLLSRLKSMHPHGASLFIEEIAKLSDIVTKGPELLALLDEATGLINRHILQEQISNGLQIERLKSMRTWGLLLFAAFLMASPLVINLSTLKGWPSQFLMIEPVMVSWVNALGVTVMGATGGFISGLLQVRGSRVTLTEYQENMLKLQIKPLIGAIISLVLVILLSWEILAGVTIQNPGSYFLIAFLSGFSERYFLRLLDIKDDEGVLNKAPAVPEPSAEDEDNFRTS